MRARGWVGGSVARAPSQATKVDLLVYSFLYLVENVNVNVCFWC